MLALARTIESCCRKLLAKGKRPGFAALHWIIILKAETTVALDPSIFWQINCTARFGDGIIECKIKGRCYGLFVAFAIVPLCLSQLFSCVCLARGINLIMRSKLKRYTIIQVRTMRFVVLLKIKASMPVFRKHKLRYHKQLYYNTYS